MIPLIKIVDCIKKNKSLRKEDMAEEIARRLRQECPGVSLLNASTIRSFIIRLLDYNNLDSENQNLYAFCKASTFSVPINGSKFSISVIGNTVLKVCPSCNFTASIQDPICPNCNNIYNNYVLEKKAVERAILSLLPDTLISASASNNVVLNDTAEGFVVTEQDINRYLKDIHKYKPVI